MKSKVYQAIASNLQWLNNLDKSENDNKSHWQAIANDLLYQLENNFLPSGSGIDSGCKIDLEKSNENRIVITFGFHHMDENGYYDGWTYHKAVITPSLTNEFDLRITGKNRNDVKDYLFDTFDYQLRQSVIYNQDTEKYVLITDENFV